LDIESSVEGTRVKVLVTGAAGFIGSRIAREVARRGHDVVAADMFLDRLYSNELKHLNWDQLSDFSNIEKSVVDLRGELSALPDEFDVIVNAAAMPGLMSSWSEFDTYMTCNIKLVENLVSHRVSENTHFIQLSTSSVYGLDATRDEASACQPTSPYGVTKLAAEELIRAHHRTNGLHHTILRYFSVFGPGQRPDMAYHKLIEAIANDQEFTVFGDGLQSRTNTFVDDCVGITATVAESAATNEVFNVAGSEPVTLNHAIATIEAEVGKKANLKHAPARKGDQRTTAGATEKIRAAFEFVPATTFRDGIRAQVEWQLAT
jgi:nucleoside-diphosphate-sugar epimerase